MSAAPLLAVAGAELFYDHVHALKGVSLDVHKGETVALIGANGAGKSSLLRAVTGLRRLSSGTIHFAGERIDGERPDAIVRRGIVMVPEGRRVFPFMSVRDNLMMGAFTRTSKAEMRESIERVLARFPRLKERYSQAAGTMSGGEQQMLAMGRALMARPKVLLMDEPSMGLSPIMVDKIFEVVNDIHRQGTTILLVEQNASRALQIASRGYVMDSGEVTMTGEAAQLLADPKVRAAYLGE